jgi:hypothetical protein
MLPLCVTMRSVAVVEFAGCPVSRKLEREPPVAVHPDVVPGVAVQPPVRSLMGIPFVPCPTLAYAGNWQLGNVLELGVEQPLGSPTPMQTATLFPWYCRYSAVKLTPIPPVLLA